ncbi:MAG TPA: tetratricopeptide repeat protein, partial [Polyangiaceae bacterium]
LALGDDAPSAGDRYRNDEQPLALSDGKGVEPADVASSRGGYGSMRPGAGGGGLAQRSSAEPNASGRAAPAEPSFAPPPAASAPAPAQEQARAEPKKKPLTNINGDSGFVLEPTPRRPPPQRWVPMRRIWERKAEIFADRFVPKAASASALSDAERELVRDDSRRQSLQKAFALSSAAGDLVRAASLAERWLEKEPLDPDAITALADVEARRGHRDSAIRMLGSVLDVRPGDTAAHRRLARLERWAGRPELACRHSIAIAEGKSSDLALVAEAVRCARATGMAVLADALLAAAAAADRESIERRVEQRPADDTTLAGDVRLEASWSGGPDLDLALLDTEGHRVSWLGAGTRAVISARDAVSSSREGLALRGAAPGEYVVELTRGSGAGSAQGELVLSVAGTTRRIPFNFDGDRKTVAVLRISMQSRLVPL